MKKSVSKNHEMEKFFVEYSRDHSPRRQVDVYGFHFDLIADLLSASYEMHGKINPKCGRCHQTRTVRIPKHLETKSTFEFPEFW